MLRQGRKHFCGYCLHACITEVIPKHHINNCFKVDGKKTNKMTNKVK